jgi:hypothetical protein
MNEKIAAKTPSSLDFVPTSN